MVALQSPKLSVRVRILVGLPHPKSKLLPVNPTSLRCVGFFGIRFFWVPAPENTHLRCSPRIFWGPRLAGYLELAYLSHFYFVYLGTF